MPEDSLKWEDEKIVKALSKENEVALRVAGAIYELEQPFTALILIEAKDYAKAKSDILEKYGKENQTIYITLNSGFEKIKHDFDKSGKAYGNIHFIDMVSIEAGEKQIEAPNVSYVNSPSDLTDAILLVEKKLSATGENGKVLVILDSISTMLIYNNATVVEKFCHTLLGKINSYAASAIVFSSD